MLQIGGKIFVNLMSAWRLRIGWWSRFLVASGMDRRLAFGMIIGVGASL
jgi:hypothetical protein